MVAINTLDLNYKISFHKTKESLHSSGKPLSFLFQTYMCKFCGTRYCKECLRGDFTGLMLGASRCRICNQVHRHIDTYGTDAFYCGKPPPHPLKKKTLQQFWDMLGKCMHVAVGWGWDRPSGWVLPHLHIYIVSEKKLKHLWAYMT